MSHPFVNPDRDRVRRNALKMREQGATDEELQQYLASEDQAEAQAPPGSPARMAHQYDTMIAAGVSPDAARQHIMKGLAPMEAPRQEDALDRLIGGSQQVVHGAALGFGDELAGLGAAGEAALKGQSVAEAYRRARDVARAQMSQYQGAHPTEAQIEQFAGKLVPYLLGGRAVAGGLKALGVGGSLVPEMMGGAALGATVEGASAAGNAAGDLATRLRAVPDAARTGAAYGAGGAAFFHALPGVARLGERIGDIAGGGPKPVAAAGPSVVRTVMERMPAGIGKVSRAVNRVRDLFRSGPPVEAEPPAPLGLSPEDYQAFMAVKKPPTTWTRWQTPPQTVADAVQQAAAAAPETTPVIDLPATTPDLPPPRSVAEMVRRIQVATASGVRRTPSSISELVSQSPERFGRPLTASEQRALQETLDRVQPGATVAQLEHRAALHGVRTPFTASESDVSPIAGSGPYAEAFAKARAALGPEEPLPFLAGNRPGDDLTNMGQVVNGPGTEAERGVVQRMADELARRKYSPNNPYAQWGNAAADRWELANASGPKVGGSLMIRAPQSNAGEPEALASLARPGHAYRGMTSAEYEATLGRGRGILSRGDFSAPSEGTSFASDPADAESYVNFGRTDPRKTGQPTYLVEVNSPHLQVDPRDGYLKPPPGVEIPASQVTRVWKMQPSADGSIMAQGASGPKGSGGLVDRLKGTLSDESGRIGPLYHGSRHKFEQFDASKIGTGEGAQAYGHGLYLAEDPKVAEYYKNALSGRVFKIGDKTLLPTASRSFAAESQTMGEQIAADELDNALNAQSSSPAQYAANRLKSLRKTYPDQAANIDDALGHIGRWANEGSVSTMAGAKYTTELPSATADDFLHWDKPLSEQPVKVQQAIGLRIPDAKAPGLMELLDEARRTGTPLAKLPGYESMVAEANAPVGPNPKMTGAEYYNSLGLKQPDASSHLATRGIRGIKYLDQGSRSAGEGTYNYVVFDPADIKILSREGKAALQMMAGAGGAAGGALTVAELLRKRRKAVP